jgi:Fe2+ or Zn2+ uptake regulation protein
VADADPHETLQRRLTARGVRPSSQRLAIAEYVLRTTEHPTADDVFRRVTERHPAVSRATVYNTLQTFVAKGLLRTLVVTEGRIAYDPNLEPHHHFVDDRTGEVRDVPWTALEVGRVEQLEGMDVREFSVVLRGTRSAPRP